MTYHIDHLRRQLALASSASEVCQTVLETLVHHGQPNVIRLHGEAPFQQIPAELLGISKISFNFVANSPRFGDLDVSGAQFISRVSSDNSELGQKLLESSGYGALALVPVYVNHVKLLLLEVSYSSFEHRWTFEDKVFIERVAEYAGLHLARTCLEQSPQRMSANLNEDSSSVGEWISKAPNIVTVETNDAFTVSSIAGDTFTMLGLNHQQIVGNRDFWARVLHPSDAKKMLLKTQRGEPKPIKDEFRITHQQTGQMHALLVSAHPRLNEEGKFEGWSGFALDVTDRYEARRELLLERTRLEALYKVSRAQQSSASSSIVALKSLQVLISVTQADAGFVVMNPRGLDQLEVVAAAGFPLEQVEQAERGNNFRDILDQKSDMERVTIFEGRNAGPSLQTLLGAEFAEWRIAQVALKSEGQEFGALFLCARRPKFFSSADLDLLDAAASQVALSTRQAELFLAEKEQASSLAALYRLSHELSQQLSAQDVIDHAVPIIKDELACKRIWLGVMNEQQTLLVGQSGIGPGMRDGVGDVRIDLSIPHPFLDTAIRTRQSVIVPVGSYTVCSDLRRMFDRLEVGPFALVPLVALGQVVGVLAVEPLAVNSFFGERKRQLLDSMASEIATIILARRFESRVADSAKMRMAALLSSGVAHNFNNLLQAIMGQASLIEMESLTQEQRGKIARMIMDAASKGANLVKQLYSFSSEATFSPDFLSLKSLLMDLKDRFKAQLGSEINLQFQLAEDTLEIKGDSSMMQQVFSNLIQNAKEALVGVENPSVKVGASRIRVRAGEIHADLAPGSYVSISIEDNGQGMTEEEAERCFEPFFTTKNVDPRTGLSYSGAGLGLSSAYLIVRQHEGAIVVRSHKGQGSSFTVYLPVVTLKSKDSGQEAQITLEKLSTQRKTA